jgi:DNA invertase Pin-like site-specific DNA recombinase
MYMQVRIIEPFNVVDGLKKKVCGYARVSTGLKRQEDSLENQEIYYEKLIKANSEWEFIDVFVDQGFSGYSSKRPEFQRMLNKARNHEIELIITKSISRYARNTLIVLETIRELKTLGIGVYFEEENIKTLSGDGELMLSILSSIAQEELRSTSENYKWVFQKKFENGEIILNTSRFLGYDKGPNSELIINIKEAEIVRKIYERYLSGVGSFTIAKELNEQMVPTVAGGKWHPGVIRGILKNEKYKGDVKLHKWFTKETKKNHSNLNRGESYSYYIEEHHEPIISKDDWNRAQELMELNCKKKNIDRISTKKYENKYPFTGKLFCGKCGSTLRRQQIYRGKIQWQCSNYVENGKKKCEGVKIYETQLIKDKISEPTIVKEEISNGKKNYIYTSKSDTNRG